MGVMSINVLGRAVYKQENHQLSLMALLLNNLVVTNIHLL
jgi:hypothetical protein